MKNRYFRTIVLDFFQPHNNYMDDANNNITRYATITNVADGTTEVVALYTVPAGITAEAFEDLLNGLLAKVVA